MFQIKGVLDYSLYRFRYYVQDMYKEVIRYLSMVAERSSDLRTSGLSFIDIIGYHCIIPHANLPYLRCKIEILPMKIVCQVLLQNKSHPTNINYESKE